MTAEIRLYQAFLQRFHVRQRRLNARHASTNLVRDRFRREPFGQRRTQWHIPEGALEER